MTLHQPHLDKPYIIFALDTAEPIPQEDIEGWFEEAAAYRNWGVKRLVGAWEGKEETSYIASAELESQLFHSWCKHQDAILYLSPVVSGYRQAWLHYRDGRKEHIGQWRLTSAERAKERSGWTFDPATQQYWVAM